MDLCLVLKVWLGLLTLKAIEASSDSFVAKICLAILLRSYLDLYQNPSYWYCPLQLTWKFRANGKLQKTT